MPISTTSPTTILRPHDAGYDAHRGTFNVLIDQRPAAIAVPASPDEVAAALAFARDEGLRVAPQGTGHNAGPLGDLSGTLLLRTSAMGGAEVDVARRSARAGSGARWRDVAPQAAAGGLAALHGSSQTVGLAGYTLGGGIGWFARRHGLAAESVTAIELVLADGEHVRATAQEEAGLFWALRGGGGGFGVVTALEFDLHPIDDLTAGALFFPLERAVEVLRTWHAALPGLSDDVTSVGRVLRFPPFPEVPEPLRGNAYAIVELAAVGRAGDELVRALRALGPVMDTVAPAPLEALFDLHMDPVDPVPFGSAHRLTDELPVDVLEAWTEAVLASPAVLMGELRHLGGALRHGGTGALGGLDAEFAFFAGGVPVGPEAAAVAEGLNRVSAVLAPHDAGRYLNFTEQPDDSRRFWRPEVHERLALIRAEVDPDGLLQPNHGAA